jgi:hypothetical protein
MAKAAAKTKARTKSPVSEKREYKNSEGAARQKFECEAKGFKFTRKGNLLYIKK